MSTLPSSSAAKKPRFTIEQYLKFERTASQRHEFLDGVIYAMAGESVPHGQITTNLCGLLYAQLKGRPCQAFTKDTKIFSNTEPPDQRTLNGLFSYPDVVVICGEIESLDERHDVLLNPTVIFEVLSPSTEAFDRGDKFQKYQANASLRNYVLVSQTSPHVDLFFKETDKWMFRSANGLHQTVALPSIGCTLPLIDVYDRVAFPPDDDRLDEISMYAQPK